MLSSAEKYIKEVAESSNGASCTTITPLCPSGSNVFLLSECRFKKIFSYSLY